MLSDTDIKTILEFTSGEMDEMSEESPGATIHFGHDGVRFELIFSPRTPFLALFVSPAGQGAILQYQFPVTTVTETPESFEPGGIHVIACLNFYGGTCDRRVLVIYKSNGKFSADPIWDGDPAAAEITKETKT